MINSCGAKKKENLQLHAETALSRPFCASSRLKGISGYLFQTFIRGHTHLMGPE